MQERGTVPPLTQAARRRYVIVGGVAALVIAVDQLTKWWAADRLQRGPITIVGPIRLALSHNTGAAFGLGRGLLPVVVLAVLALVVVLVTVGRSIDRPILAVALGLVLGGALGNLADRLFRAPGLFRGAVVDFVDLRWWPVFNVADAAITIGCVVLIVLSFGRPRPAP